MFWYTENQHSLAISLRHITAYSGGPNLRPAVNIVKLACHPICNYSRITHLVSGVGRFKAWSYLRRTILAFHYKPSVGSISDLSSSSAFRAHYNKYIFHRPLKVFTAPIGLPKRRPGHMLGGRQTVVFRSLRETLVFPLSDVMCESQRDTSAARKIDAVGVLRRLKTHQRQSAFLHSLPSPATIIITQPI